MAEPDRDLADRLRSMVGMLPDVTERRMFGSTAFLLDGHILIAARRNGSALVQVGKARNAAALARDGTTQMTMKRGPMPGFVVVGPDAIETDEALRDWIEFAEPYVRSLSVP